MGIKHGNISFTAARIGITGGATLIMLTAVKVYLSLNIMMLSMINKGYVKIETTGTTTLIMLKELR